VKLDSFALLEDLGAGDRGCLGGYLEYRRFSRGQHVFSTGEEAAELFLVAEGRVRIEAAGRPYGALGAGEVFGALSLVAIGSRQCEAIADDDVTLLALSREAYLRLRSEAPAVALAVQESILRRFSASVRAVLDVARSAPQS
jgi:CRP-like cAMP-binding protein